VSRAPILSPPDLGIYLRDARRAKDWTQSQLAERTSMRQLTISNIERGVGSMPLARLITLIAALGLAPVQGRLWIPRPQSTTRRRLGLVCSKT